MQSVQGVVVDVPVNLQQFMFVAGANCAEHREFPQVQFMSTLRAQCLVRQWIHVLRQFLGAFERVHTFSTSRWNLRF